MSGRLEHAMLMGEKRAEAKRGLIYTGLLILFVCVALATAFVVFGIACVDHGIEVGKKIERDRQEAIPKPAPASCKDWLRHCSAETLEAWKKPWRKPA